MATIFNTHDLKLVHRGTTSSLSLLHAFRTTPTDGIENVFDQVRGNTFTHDNGLFTRIEVSTDTVIELEIDFTTSGVGRDGYSVFIDINGSTVKEFSGSSNENRVIHFYYHGNVSTLLISSTRSNDITINRSVLKIHL